MYVLKKYAKTSVRILGGYLNNISFTLKMAAITIIVGIAISSVLNHFHGKILKETFNEQLYERLKNQASEDRQKFDDYFLSYHRTVELLVSRYALILYVERVSWGKASWDGGKPVIIYSEIPPWLPNVVVLKRLESIEYALLYDEKERLREAYNGTPDPMPVSLTSLSNLIIRLSLGQSFLTKLDNVKYVISSERVSDGNGKKIATLVIVHRISDDLLIDAVGSIEGRSTVVLADGQDHAILATNKPDLILHGVKLEDLKDKFMFTGESFLNYGESEVKLMFASLIPLDEVNNLSTKILSGSLRFNILTALALILSFVTIMLYVMRRIGKLDVYIADVSRQHLGLEPPESVNGDQLLALEKRFYRLFDEIVLSRKSLEEKASDLEKANRELKESTAYMIQVEKLSALGKLTAGVAHEVNTPLGVIRASNANIHDAINYTLNHLPKLIQFLSSEMLLKFFDLIERSTTSKKVVSTKEERKFRKVLIEQLGAEGIDEAEVFADTLVDMGIYENIGPFLPLFKGDGSLFILKTAYNISELYINSKNIATAVNRAAKIVFALKTYAHHDSSDKTVLSDIIENIEIALTLYYNKFKHSVEVIRDYQKIPQVQCYPDELNQVWVNLIHNALQAMAYKGVLKVEVYRDSGNVIVKITDSGCGITGEIKERIFEPFFTTKPIGEGTGLGLDICNKIIKKHNGVINVESEPGRTTFSVYLPISKPEET
ncbi:MAG: GHKL domain-containing protein [Nitrospirae bacterium]|nr:GHKL domain-containing protein [Nitrospirota bacterium]